MIYTCTFNPSLDYYLEFSDEIQSGKTNRSSLEYFEAGGKGINVSIVLSNLMVPSKALGFVGGFTKDFYLKLLERYTYLQPNFTYVEGHTRINVKATTKVTTELNAVGPYIDFDAQTALLKRIDRIDENDFFILSGNIQKPLQHFAEEIIKHLSAKGVRIVLDTDPEMLKKLIVYKPLLIKPNLDELNALCDSSANSIEEALPLAKQLHQQGVQNVIASLGPKGSLLVCSQGIYRADVLDEVVIGTTGSGDSMIAGFVFNIQRGFGVIDAYRYAACSGLATTYSQGLATRDQIENYFEGYEIIKIEE